MPANTSDTREQLRAFAHDAPLEPGVYLWKDDTGCIIYVGKAKVLRNRLSSYFSGEKDPKTAALIRHAASIETIIVASEYDALLLENTLIKQHSPKYNIDLKDGKSYPVIRVTAERYPRVFKTRHVAEDGSRYYGPFPNVQAVDTTMEMVEKIFPLRKCRILRKRESPCIYFHIGRCLAPCCKKIGEKGYAAYIAKVEKILSGNAEPLIFDMTAAMHEAAAALDFEKAANLRDQIAAIEALSSNSASNVVDMDSEARDYIAWASEGVLATFAVFSLRGGKMTGRDIFRTRSAANEAESLETFITTYYDALRPPSPKIYVQELEGRSGESGIGEWEAGREGEERDRAMSGGDALPLSSPPIASYLKNTFGFAPEILTADGKHHEAVLAMARQNAAEDLRKRLKERGAGPALDELMQALHLKRRPERIEGFDIAQLDGKHPVASLISFRNGAPDRKNYRIFKLRTVVGIVDDFAAMREAVSRRYSRLLREGADMPDLILIDGGIGQVNAAKGVLETIGLDIDIAGLAKRDEELWLPEASAPIKLSRRSEALKVLQFVRDETHRFATSFNQKLRSEDICFSVLENIDGIGGKTAAIIMKSYASLERIAATPPEQLAEKCGVTAEKARAVRIAAELALKDQAAAKQRFSQGVGRSAPKGGFFGGSGEAAGLAAEALAEYD
jgi:excinuclease ABC subunit C